MSVSEQERHALYLAFEELIGTERAGTMMSMLPPVGWADLATKHDLDTLRVATKHDLDAVGERIELGVKKDMAELETRIERALRDQLRVMVFALIAALATMTTLNLTAVALLR